MPRARPPLIWGRIYPSRVFTRCSLTSSTYSAIKDPGIGIIIVEISRMNRTLRPGNFSREKAYAASEEKRITPPTTVKV